MSWDIFVQDIPNDIEHISDVPADFIPKPIGCRADVINAITKIVPSVVIDNPSWVVIENNEINIEVNLGDTEELICFAFHVRGGSGSRRVVSEILSSLGLRAIDPNSEDGFFHSD